MQLVVKALHREWATAADRNPT